MKILCTLPNASHEINGVAFTPHPDGMLSEDVSQEVAQQFLAIPGYQYQAAPLAYAAPPPAPEPAPEPEPVAVPEPEPEPEPEPQPVADEPAPADDAAADAEPADADAADPDIDEITALRREAEALGVRVNLRWKEDRLRSEIAHAKAVAAGE